MDTSNKKSRGLMIIACLMLAFLILAISSSYGASVDKKQAKIVNFRFVIKDWHAEGKNAILIETLGNKFYRAEFSFPCDHLPFQEAIAFNTLPTGELNQFSSITTEYEKCYFKSLVEIPDPSESATH